MAHLKGLWDLIGRCVTFDTPGIIQYWRKLACEEGEERWKGKIHNYLSYPNLINTALPKIGRNIRLEMDLHRRCLSLVATGPRRFESPEEFFTRLQAIVYSRHTERGSRDLHSAVHHPCM